MPACRQARIAAVVVRAALPGSAGQAEETGDTVAGFLARLATPAGISHSAIRR
jgi:hypothetical protein